MVLVNSKSGGGQGEKLLTTFKRLLNPFQVVDLLQGGPLPASVNVSYVKYIRIMLNTIYYKYIYLYEYY